MTFYQGQFILTELMMMAMTLHVLHYTGFTKRQKTWFVLTFVAIMLCSGAEFAVHNGRYNPSFAIPLTIITVLQFSLSPMLAVLFSGALGMRNQGKVAVIFLILNLAVEISLAPSGGVFYFNSEGYFRGNLFIIYEVCYLISLLYLIINMIMVGKRFQRRDLVTIIMILVILIAGIIPMTLYKVNITYVAIAICASISYIYYNDLVQQDIKKELVRNQKKMSRMQEHIISALANLIESRDMETGEHILRTSAYVKALARFCLKDGVYTDQLDNHFISLLGMLAPMHDIGKIVVPDTILKKPARLTEEEYEEMKKHAAAGGRIVREVLNGVTDGELVKFASDMAKYHHEWWDGTGYPEGLKGEAIPLSARIMAVADVLDALISERCYKSPVPFEESVDIMKDEGGTHFDPALIDVLLRHRDDFRRIRF
ncbi:MAG: HD domain-containing protein [Spirochaetales bacterium]|nr:HD domain-containing protein [Spirochaetales bacterium]